MKCPVCRSMELERKEAELGLKSYYCGNCEGNWIRFADYEEWNRNNQVGDGDCCEDYDYRPEYDSKKATLCPDCGIILIKFKVASGIPFSVDHCGSCNGVWLDRNEWESLIENDLHHYMNKFFTNTWQKKLRDEMTMHRLEEHYKNKFGHEDYERLKSVRQWINESRLKGEMVAYLIDADPYKL